MPTRALQHFRDDVRRSRSLLEIARGANSIVAGAADLTEDLHRCAWMFAVGALDAYFCDAYADVVAATIIAKKRQPAVALPDFFDLIRFPVRAIVEPYDRENWRWRMAARKLMAYESVLSLREIEDLFRKFLPRTRRFFGVDLVQEWLGHSLATKRMFGIDPRSFAALAVGDKPASVAGARKQFEDRFQEVFQRRHDCIHNCDRPKMRPQPLRRAQTVKNVIDDLEFLVLRCDEHLQTEIPRFLANIGCSTATIASVGY